MTQPAFFNEIIERVKEIKGLKEDREVALLLGFERSAFSERKRRGAVPMDRLELFCSRENINMTWILTGNGWTYMPKDPKDAFEWIKKRLELSDVKRVEIISYEPPQGEGGGILNGFILSSLQGFVSLEGSTTRSGYKGTGPRYYAEILNLLNDKNIPTWRIDYKGTAVNLEEMDISSLIPPLNAPLLSIANELKRIDYEQKDMQSSINKEPISVLNDDFVFVPQVSGEISAGGGLVADNTVEMKIAFRKEWIERRGDPRNMSLIRVSGDSMEPTLQSGDLVLVDHGRNFIDPQGGIYAIAMDDTIMIKRLQLIYPTKTLKVISDNSRYEPLETATDQVRINGKVIWFGRELER